MKAKQYQELRLIVGTQEKVSKMIGVHRVTLARRETGTGRISPESAMAMRWLAWKAFTGQNP